MADQRPDPDQLLARVQAEEQRAQRGKLKIFFGASAGVGKTYAMLSAARAQRDQGVDVIVGVVETHGRKETAALLAGLEQLPQCEIGYRERTLSEFDLDGALKREPALILVDELAHSNVDGSRHPKRWQDVQELLDAGIDVWTTVNVQHIESLNDVVGGITGIRVRETVPDHVFDAADEVVIVDLPPDDLLQRLREGKVYLPQQAERAIRNFFRKGNLIALRELALRRTADRVDDEMRQYRREQSIGAVWGARDSLLVCVGPDSGDERVVRHGARLAAQLDVPWHAVYVETPQLQRLPATTRQRILQTLQLAQQLGAETATLPGNDIATALVDYARSHNLVQLLLGRGDKTSRWPWRRPLAQRIGLLAGDLATVQVSRETAAPVSTAAHDHDKAARPFDWKNYGYSALVCGAVIVATAPLHDMLELANIIMVMLLAVVMIAVRLGRGPAVFASFVTVGAFNFFFVPPRLTFAVSDAEYIITFAVMLSVALITGHLTADLKYQARVAIHRERRARSLFELARELSAALMQEQIGEIVERFIAQNFHARAALMPLDIADKLVVPAIDGWQLDAGIAQWAYKHGQAAGATTDTLPGAGAIYLPLLAPVRARGVLVVQPRDLRPLLIPEQRLLLETVAALAAIAVERLHYVAIAQQTTVQIESERLRNSLLSALSHDLRTPLTALLGQADYLTLTQPPLAGEQRELAQSISDEARRLALLVDNLLDMARLQAGEVTLNRQWQPLEEVVGAVLGNNRAMLAHHRVRALLPPELPLLQFDAVLLERVLFNLLENAAKYSPRDGRIELSATVVGSEAHIYVDDDGPGLPTGREQEIFRKFSRGDSEGSTPGVGLGLAICRAIIEAHGGQISAEPSPLGGARFDIALPLGTPPALSTLDAPSALDVPVTTPQDGATDNGH